MNFGSLSVKLIAALLVVVCLVIGAVGIVLPIIPGLLFLALAALIATRHFPPTEFWLRKSRSIGGYLDRSDAVAALDLKSKLLLGGLLGVKLLIDGAAFAAGVFKRLVVRPKDGPRYYP